MTLGLGTRILMRQLDDSENKRRQLNNQLIEMNRRFAVTQIMLDGFKKQAGELPVGDPVKFAFETLIDTIEKVIHGKVVGNAPDAG